MKNSALLQFIVLLVVRHREKHLSFFVISLFIVALLSSVMMVAQSIKHNISSMIDGQPDLLVQAFKGGKVIETPLQWRYEIESIPGVSDVSPRVYGNYFVKPNERYMTIVGIDPFDTMISGTLQRVLNDLDMKAFLEHPQMIVGYSVKTLLDEMRYGTYYEFRKPDFSKVRLDIYKTLPKADGLQASDMAIMPIDHARQILGQDDSVVTDLGVFIANPLEVENIKNKIILMFPHVRVIDKQFFQRSYSAFFDFKSGLFLALYTIVLSTFLMLLYQRYMMISKADRKEIGIMRAMGWSIGAVIKMKLSESLSVAVLAFMAGFLAAYGFVYGFNAPFLAELFLGHGNLPVYPEFAPTLDFGLFAMLFVFYIIPVSAAIMIPVWRIAITDPVEAMK